MSDMVTLVRNGERVTTNMASIAAAFLMVPGRILTHTDFPNGYGLSVLRNGMVGKDYQVRISEPGGTLVYDGLMSHPMEIAEACHWAAKFSHV